MNINSTDKGDYIPFSSNLSLLEDVLLKRYLWDMEWNSKMGSMLLAPHLSDIMIESGCTCLMMNGRISSWTLCFTLIKRTFPVHFYFLIWENEYDTRGAISPILSYSWRIYFLCLNVLPSIFERWIFWRDLKTKRRNILVPTIQECAKIN